jgi:hypothetical protein
VTRSLASTLLAATALAILTACETSNIASPRDPGAILLDRSGSHGVSCTITLPAPAHRPLPAVRETARELNEAFGKSSSQVSCGAINGINQRFNQLVSFLDQPSGEQNLNGACGVATGLGHELEALAQQGMFNPIVTHPPEAGDNVVENMQFIAAMFCENARAS